MSVTFEKISIQTSGHEQSVECEVLFDQRAYFHYITQDQMISNRHQIQLKGLNETNIKSKAQFQKIIAEGLLVSQIGNNFYINSKYWTKSQHNTPPIVFIYDARQAKNLEVNHILHVLYPVSGKDGQNFMGLGVHFGTRKETVQPKEQSDASIPVDISDQSCSCIIL